MIPNNNQDELVKFLKIVLIKVREHEEAFKKFLVKIDRPIIEISHNYTDINLEQEQDSHAAEQSRDLGHPLD